MPIVSINTATDTLVRHCSGCGGDENVTISTLKLGHATDPNVIVLPPCSLEGCSAQEFLVRNWDTHPAEDAGSVWDQQRKASNALAKYLKEQGQSHADQLSTHDAEGSDPLDINALPLASVDY